MTAKHRVIKLQKTSLGKG